MKHEKVELYTISLFLFSSFVAMVCNLDSVSVLRFNFVFLVCVFPVGDAYFRFGICVSVF